jgi:hypothetical protein
MQDEDQGVASDRGDLSLLSLLVMRAGSRETLFWSVLFGQYTSVTGCWRTDPFTQSYRPFLIGGFKQWPMTGSRLHSAQLISDANRCKKMCYEECLLLLGS